MRSDSVAIPLFCRYCGERIVHDGKHWVRLHEGGPNDGVVGLRNCPKSPIMVRFHVPEGVGEEKRRTHCIPEVP